MYHRVEQHHVFRPLDRQAEDAVVLHHEWHRGELGGAAPQHVLAGLVVKLDLEMHESSC